jgi:23S rRNA (cytosine1962-C5)-methyltransferase
MASIQLKPGREKSLLRRHPWIFSGAVAEVRGSPDEGETVEVADAQGKFLAWAAYSPHSQIRARAWSWIADEKIGPDLLRTRLASAISARRLLIGAVQTNAQRLVHGESDGLPGLIVDRYGPLLVAQYLSAGPERWRETISDLLMELTGADALYERSDADVRSLEGLRPRTGLLRGVFPSNQIQIEENKLRYWVDHTQGHKTGFYLDQRENRQQVGRLAGGREVLDCFSYTGGFALSCLAGGAKFVLAVDASAEALDRGRDNLQLNGLPEEQIEWLQGDVFRVLRTLRDSRRSFDLIILDPPKFAANAAQVEQAARGYKDINLLAFKLLRPRGLLATFSCSGGVSDDLFQKIVAGAALDARVDAQIIQRLHQAPDHPVALNFPEGAYLKGLVTRVQG